MTRNSYDGGNLFSQVKDNGTDDRRHNAAFVWAGIILTIIVAVGAATYFL